MIKVMTFPKKHGWECESCSDVACCQISIVDEDGKPEFFYVCEKCKKELHEQTKEVMQTVDRP